MNTYNVNIDKIKNLAKEQGITMKYFCDAFGKRHNYLSEVRAGKSRLNENELSFIADKLNTTVEYLTDQTEQKEKPIIYNDEREQKLAVLDSMVDAMNDEQLDFYEKMAKLALAPDADFEKILKMVELLTSEKQ